MTVHEAASTLNITPYTLKIRVYERRLRPEQAIGSVSPSEWTFTAAEIERFRAKRDAGIDARRAWNGCRPGGWIPA